jgi:hypothetical protein
LAYKKRVGPEPQTQQNKDVILVQTILAEFKKFNKKAKNKKKLLMSFQKKSEWVIPKDVPVARWKELFPKINQEFQ